MRLSPKVIVAALGVAGVGGLGVGKIATEMLADVEGERIVAYLDVVGVPTVCYGETLGVRLGDELTHEQCLGLLEAHVAHTLEFVYSELKWVPPDPTTAALVSFVYNVGEASAARSTAFRLMREHNVYEGCQALGAWTKATYRRRDGRPYKVTVPGLVNRRAKEIELCLLGITPTNDEAMRGYDGD